MSRKEHLHRHMKNVHGEGNSVQSNAMVNGSLASNSSTTEDDMYTDDEIEVQSEESYTAEETGEETVEESSQNYDESEEEDNNPWKLILNEIYQKMRTLYVTLPSIKQCKRARLPMKKPQNTFTML